MTLINYSVKRFDPKDLDGTYEDDLMQIETTCFEEDIQETWESKMELIEESAVALFAYTAVDYHPDNAIKFQTRGKIIGEAYTSQGEAGDMGEPGHPDTIHLQEVFDKMKFENGVYFMSFAVLPEYQGQGIGKKLVSEMVEICRNEGFKFIYTHAEAGASAHIFQMVGGEFIEARENWFDTGHTHLLYKIPLTKRVFFKE